MVADNEEKICGNSLWAKFGLIICLLYLLVFGVLYIAFLTVLRTKLHTQFVTFVTPAEDSYKFAVFQKFNTFEPVKTSLKLE